MYELRLILKKDNKLFINQGQYYNIIMEYQEIANLLDSTSNQPSKFRTRNWVEINMNQEEHILVTILNLKL